MEFDLLSIEKKVEYWELYRAKLVDFIFDKETNEKYSEEDMLLARAEYDHVCDIVKTLHMVTGSTAKVPSIEEISEELHPVCTKCNGSGWDEENPCKPCKGFGQIGLPTSKNLTKLSKKQSDKSTRKK
jgi:DnaJ-class molecular chaperone